MGGIFRIKIAVPAILFVLISTAAYCTDTSDRLMVIRGSFRDGLSDIVRTEAESFLQEAPNDPNAPEVALMLGLTEQKAGHLKRAAKAFKKAVKSKNQRIRSQAEYALGTVEWKRKNFSEAAHWFGKAGDDFSDDTKKATAVLWQGINLFECKEWQTAARVFTAGEPLFSDTQLFKMKYYRGICHLRLEAPEKAFRDLKAAYDHGDSEIKIKCAYPAATYGLRHHLSRAATDWTYRLLQVEKSGKSYLLAAWVAYDRKDLPTASYYFRQAAAMFDSGDRIRENAEYYAVLCDAAYLEHTDQPSWPALADFFYAYPKKRTEIIQELLSTSTTPIPVEILDFFFYDFNSDNQDVCRSIAALYLNSGAVNPAYFWVLKGIISGSGETPSDAELVLLAKIMQASGHPEEALRALQELPGGSETHSGIDRSLAMAELSFQAGEFASSAALYQQWITDNPDAEQLPAALFWLGECYFRMENWELANAAFLAYLEKDFHRPDYDEAVFRRLISGHFKLKQWQDVVDACNQYLSRYPNATLLSEILFYKGLAQANLGYPDKGAATLSQALDSGPDAAYIEAIKKALRTIEKQRRNRENAQLKTPQAMESPTVPSPEEKREMKK